MTEEKSLNLGTKPFRKNVNKLLHYMEWVGLLVIVIATVTAFLTHILQMIQLKVVALHDLLLLFIYIEIITMVGQYFNTGRLPIRYPIYIAIVAIARYIIIDMKDLKSLDIISLCIAILVLTLAALAIRFGHFKMPYQSEINQSHD